MCSTPGVEHGEQVAQDKQVARGGGEGRRGVGVDTQNPPTAAYRGMLPRSTLTLTPNAHNVKCDTLNADVKETEVT
jgi:hypothetical protein